MSYEREIGGGVRYEIFPQVAGEITDAYLSDDRPWVVGFSGGKDSTALLQMVYIALSRLPPPQRRKQVFVLSSDTRVETPSITRRIHHELERIAWAAKQSNLPLTTHLVFPRLNDTFWVNLIGRGYPSPSSQFRWCTDRLKIAPVSEFIRRTVDASGEVVVVLGARKDESASRAQTLRKTSIAGNRFRPHAELPRAWVYTPIEDLTANEIWTYLLQVSSPWGGDNRGLVKLYKQASGGECPLVIDASTPSCGHSRFGCWTCTVVDRDKSMEGLVDSGQEHLAPLLEFRDYIKAIRDTPGARQNRRRNGRVPLRRGTDEPMQNTGPFTHSTRMAMLRRLLEAQEASGVSLIEGDEIALIQEIWNKEESRNPDKPTLPPQATAMIVEHVTRGTPMPEIDVLSDHLNDEDRLLHAVCESHGLPFDLLVRLRNIEEEYGHLRRRHGLPEEMRETVADFVERPGEE